MKILWAGVSAHNHRVSSIDILSCLMHLPKLSVVMSTTIVVSLLGHDVRERSPERICGTTKLESQLSDIAVLEEEKYWDETAFSRRS